MVKIRRKKKQKKTGKQTIVHKTQQRKLKTEQHEPHQNMGGHLMCSGRVSRSLSTYICLTIQNIYRLCSIFEFKSKSLYCLTFQITKEINKGNVLY